MLFRSLVHDAAFYESLHHVPALVHWAPAIVMALGFLIALNTYILKPGSSEAFKAQWHLLHRFLLNKWYFDELYTALFIKPALALGRLFWKRGDEGTIDRYGPDGIASAVRSGSAAAGRFESGLIYSYALVMLIGVAGFATWFIVQ